MSNKKAAIKKLRELIEREKKQISIFRTAQIQAKIDLANVVLREKQSGESIPLARERCIGTFDAYEEAIRIISK